MNNQELFDIYSDYLWSSFGPTTATGLSRLVSGSLSHDELTHLLAGEAQSSASWWQRVKPRPRGTRRQRERSDGVLIFDDSIEEKPYTDENDIICWHYDHSKDRKLKGINFLTALYYNGEVSLPVAFQLIAKSETDVEAKSGKTKNEYYRDLVTACVRNQVRFRYVLNDSW
jgi:hypothetical protein